MNGIHDAENVSNASMVEKIWLSREKEREREQFLKEIFAETPRASTNYNVSIFRENSGARFNRAVVMW